MKVKLSTPAAQDRGAFVPSSEKMVEDNFDTQQTVPYISAEAKGVHKNGTLTGNHHDRKDQVAFDAIESVKHLFMENKKLHLQMREKIHVLDQVLNGQNDVPLEERTDLDPINGYGSSVKHERLHKRRKLSTEEDVRLLHFPDVDESGNRKMLTEQVMNEANGTRYSCPVDAFIQVAQARGDILFNFEGIADGDFMKLLDLDDINEEEIYKNAMDRPLSPTLPDIGPFQASVSCEDEPRNAEIISILNKKESLAPDVTDVEMHCNASLGNGPMSSHKESMHENDGVVLDVCAQTVEAEKPMDGWTRDSRYRVETSYIPAYCVTSVEDTRSLYQVLYATRACMAHCSENTQANSILERILQAVTMQGTISSRERSCVLFTLLLHNFSTFKLVDSGRIVYKDLIVHVDSLVKDLQAVASTSGERTLFRGLCSSHELLGTIEDFLINGTIVDCTNIFPETFDEWNSKGDVPCDKEPKYFMKLATVEQLVVGSALLASICASTGCVASVCDTSYNLLQKTGCDTAHLLTIFHVFARIVGEQYFSINDYSLTINVLRSIVGWLERSSLVAPIHTCLSSNEVNGLQFVGCTKCPFGAVSVDIVTSVLLEKLWSSDNSGTTQQHRMQSTSLFEAGVVYHEHNEVDLAISRSNSIMNGTLGDTSNVLSLLELVACKMGWEWTQSKIIPELLEMMEKPLTSTFKIAVLLSLGQLGRVGVAASGYEDKGVESLNSKLSGFLRQQVTEESILPVQMATVTSLLRLQSLGFEHATDENFHCSADASPPDTISLIRHWLSRLSKDQQALSLSFLRFQIDAK